MLNLKDYIPIMKFLALYLGDDCELILCDTEKVLHIENSFDGSTHSGDPVGEVQKAFINNPKCHALPYTVNYRATSPSDEKLRSATLFIKDNEKLAGLLTINMKISSLLSLREILERMINGNSNNATHTSGIPSAPKKTNDDYENLSSSTSALINSVIVEASIRFGVTPERFTTQEKKSIVREMDARGIFLVKGSISEVARELKSSDATIYRYLQQIEK